MTRPAPPRTPGRGPRPRLAPMVVVGASAGLAFVATLVLSIGVVPVRLLDSLGSYGAVENPVDISVVDATVRVRFLAAAVLVGGAVAWWRGRRLGALAPLVLVAVPNVTAGVLKGLVVRPRSSVGDTAFNSWPSGHATAGTTLALVALLVVPPRWRPPVAVLGAGYVALIGAAVLGGHRPSDVVGGVLLAGLVACCLTPLLADRAPDPDDVASAGWSGRAGGGNAPGSPLLRRATVGALLVVGVVAALLAVAGFWVLRDVPSVDVATGSDMVVALRSGRAAGAAAGALTMAAVLALLSPAALPGRPRRAERV